MTSRLKQWANSAGRTCQACGLNWPRALTAFALAVLFIQVGSVTYYASLTADSRPVIAGWDNDGANAIDVAGRSPWWKDNGFASYGPLYFRLANSVATILQPLTAPGDLSVAEAQTKSLHFALLLVSVASLAAMAYLFASLLTATLWLRLWLTTAFIRLLLESAPARELLLRAHPDYLLAFLTGVAVWQGVLLWREPQNLARFRFSAWIWGLAMATKLSLFVFMPFVLLPVFYFCRGLKPTFAYVGHMLLAYFLIGFPQNLNIPRTLRFLVEQTKGIDPTSWETIHEWIQIWWMHGAGPLAFFLVAGLLLCVIRPIPRAQAWFSLAMGVGPFVLIALQKVLFPHTHYTFPVTASQVVLLSQLNGGARVHKWTLEGLCAAVLVLLLFMGSFPAEMNASLNGRLECRAEARAVFREISQRQQAGRTIFVDPYVPTLDHTPGIKSSWAVTKKYVRENKFDVLVLKHIFDAGYLDQNNSRYLTTYTDDQDSSRAFYSLFQGTDQVDDPEIGRFHRVYNDACSWEVWER